MPSVTPLAVPGHHNTEEPLATLTDERRYSNIDWQTTGGLGFIFCFPWPLRLSNIWHAALVPVLSVLLINFCDLYYILKVLVLRVKFVLSLNFLLILWKQIIISFVFITILGKVQTWHMCVWMYVCTCKYILTGSKTRKAIRHLNFKYTEIHMYTECLCVYLYIYKYMQVSICKQMLIY